MHTVGPKARVEEYKGNAGHSAGSKLIDALHRRVEADPSAYGIKGSLSLGVDVERMQKIKEEIEAREPVLGLGKNKKIFKRREVNNMAGVTPSKICGCGKTFAPRSNGQIRCDECRDKRKKEGNRLRAEKYRDRQVEKKRGNNGNPKGQSSKTISIYCMRCGFHMKIEQPGQFVKED